MSPALFSTVLIIGYSIIMLWRVSMLWREEGRFLPCIPFFLWGILYNALAAFVFYEMQFTFWWFILDFAFFVCYVLLLIMLIRVTQKLL